MNERIKELLEQAGVTYAVMPKDTVYEKFAELIVRECICQCDDENSQKYIMSHFGFTEKDWS
jgi:hypothetical protein